MAKQVKQLLRGVAWMGVLLAAGLAQAQTIRLHEKATVTAGDVRLGNLAAITGTDARTAEKLAETLIIADLRKSQSVRSENVLLAVVMQHGPTQTTALQMAGAAACDVQVVAALPAHVPAAEQKPVATTEQKIETPAVEKPETDAAGNSQTLAAVLTKRITDELGGREEDVRIKIETINPMMQTAPKAGQRWHIRPLNRGAVGVLQFDAQLIEGTKVVQKLTVQAKAEKRAMVVVATGPIARGKVIEPGDVKVVEAWLDRNLPTLFTKAEDAVYQEAIRAVAAGAQLDQRDFRAAEMVVKGDVVKVEFVAGTLKVEMKARAMQGGKMHDAITLRNDATGETYQGVVVGKKAATVGSAR